MQIGMNSQSIKEKNRGFVLRLLCCNEVHSRVEIAKRTGLSKMAATNIISQLIEEDIICETEIKTNSKVGRNPMGLGLSPLSPYVIGLCIARDTVYSTLSDMCCNMLKTSSMSLKNETSESLKVKIISLISNLLKHAGERRILGIGVAAIGPLDCDRGVLLNPADFFGIHNFQVKNILESAFSLPVFINNDMNAAALAELLFSNNREDEFLYIGLTNGVGAGIVSGGKLYQNNGGFSGEIGHLSIDKNGFKCSCGQHGCLELYTSIPAILNRLSQVSGETATCAQDIPRLARLPSCGNVGHEIINNLASGLISAVNLLNPNAVIIGHEGVYLPEIWLDQLAEKLNSGMFTNGHKQLEVRKASFKNVSGLAGSVCCVLEKAFSAEI